MVAPVSPTPFTPTPTPDPPAAPATARYELRFDSSWSPATHPTDFPSTAHYSGLIGGTHNSSVTFWAPGTIAGQGIKDMAERGRKSPLDLEVMSAISSGTAEFLLSGPDLPNSPGTAIMEFDISTRFPLVSVVTMVAPSPDWFVGVSGVSLFKNGQWLQDLVVDLFPFDAGTDSGATYSAPDLVTSPRAPITALTGYPVAAGGQVAPFGRFTFRKIG
jgi:hypothetical protein